MSRAARSWERVACFVAGAAALMALDCALEGREALAAVNAFCALWCVAVVVR